MISFSKYLSEAKKKIKFHIIDDVCSFGARRPQLKKLREGYYDDDDIEKIHSDSSIKPKNLTDRQKGAISKYTGSGHTNTNTYLSNRGGKKDVGIGVKEGLSQDETEKSTEQHVHTLSSAFTPENTNRKPMTLYSGISSETGKKLTDAGDDSHHRVSPFVSSSTRRDIGEEFGKDMTKKPGETEWKHHVHLMVIHAPAGTALSVAHHSKNPAENEALINHGSHFHFHGTKETTSSEGVPTTEYHVSVVPGDHQRLEDYPTKYDHPAHDKYRF